jgi:hypothetical protein
MAVSERDRDTEPRDPTKTDPATIQALTDLGAAIATHDVQPSSAGPDDVPAVVQRKND